MINKNEHKPSHWYVGNAGHQSLFPDKKIGSATKMPINASPVMSPDAKSNPLPFILLEDWVVCAIIPPMKIGVDSSMCK